MKRAFLFCLVAGMLVFGMPVGAHGTGEYIERFDVTARIQPDASVQVTETILYVFGDDDRHGIFRTIPTEYETPLGFRSIELSDVVVVDERGNPQPFDVSQEGDNRQIKIGDPDVFVSGTKTYRLSYTVSRVVTYTDQYDEFYWNATGAQWNVPIMRASAEVVLPRTIPAAEVRAACYQGSLGSVQSCTKVEDASDSVEKIRFEASRLLERGEGLTVAVGFAKGVVYEPTALERAASVATDNAVVVVPFLVLAVMFWLWYTRGRDPKGRGTIIPEYDTPDKLTPLEVSVIQNSSARNEAVSAEIVYLAVRGYLKIVRTTEKKMFLFESTDYILTKLQSGDDLSGFDKTLFDELFKAGDEIKLSSLKEKFHTTASKVKAAAKKSVISKKYYPNDPVVVFVFYTLLGGAVISVFALMGAVLGQATIFSGIASGAIIFLFGMIMPKVTKKGAVAREHIKGLKMYMDVAEKARINFHSAPEKSPELFEKLLPYAMVLGVEKAWAQQFEGIYTQSPSWYSDPSLSSFNPALFATSLHSFGTAAASTLASAPGGGTGSGGGGFSGGGFGGGGGGSW